MEWGVDVYFRKGIEDTQAGLYQKINKEKWTIVISMLK